MVHADVTGFVLAGGKSTRMGRDKAAVPLHGRTLLEHALAIVRQVCAEVCILGPRELYDNHGAAVIEDIFPGCGPLGGIHAALSHTRTHFNLIIAVDTPFLSPQVLSFMAGRAVQSGAVVTTPEIGGYRQPLCSVYSRDFLPIAERALRPQTAQGNNEDVSSDSQRRHNAEGNNVESSKSADQTGAIAAKSRDYKIVPLFPKDGTLIITEADMARFAFTPEMFENLNTPQDLERARQRGVKSE